MHVYMNVIALLNVRRPTDDQHLSAAHHVDGQHLKSVGDVVLVAMQTLSSQKVGYRPSFALNSFAIAGGEGGMKKMHGVDQESAGADSSVGVRN